MPFDKRCSSIQQYWLFSGFKLKHTKQLYLNSLSQYGFIQNQRDVIIIHMSYLNHEYSLNYSRADSSQTEVEYLKLKLIETHNKLLSELEYSKQLEDKVKDWEYRYDSTMSENDNLVKKLNNISAKYDKQRQSADKSKQLQLNLVQTEKKNDLLRIDLESMRGKMLQYISMKQMMEEEKKDHEKATSKLNEKISNFIKELKLKDLGLEQMRQEVERYKQKYDKQININKEIEHQLDDVKREKIDLHDANQQLQAIIKQEKDKQGKNINELLLLQKQAKDWKIKSQHLSDQLRDIKKQLESTRSKFKLEERSLTAQLQRIKTDYNNLQNSYRQKQAQLESTRRRPLEQANKKRNNFEQTKQLVGKLQKQEKVKFAQRTSPSPRAKQRLSPKIQQKYQRNYKQEKEEYLSMIESVGQKESLMLACNMERKRIQAQIDKIDETRVKTKDMISKRRRLQVELVNQQKRLEHTRLQLKKMKVM